MKNVLQEYIKVIINELWSSECSMSGSRRFDAPGNIRYGMNTSAEKNHNDIDDQENDDEWEEQNELRAACCIVRRDDQILVVSRGKGTNIWGLPGGRCNAAEDFENAAIRELKEETNLDVVACNFVYDGKSDNSFHTQTFACKVKGKIKSSDEGDCAWASLDVLLKPETSAFVEYFTKLLKHLSP